MARTVDPDKHRARRHQIMHAAAGLFAAQGYQATTVAQICTAAEISSGNLFHYFASKRDLFVAIVTADGDEVGGADSGDTQRPLTSALNAEDPVEGLLDYVDHLAAAAAEPAVPGLVLEAMLQASRDPQLAHLMGEDSDTEQAGVADLLSRAAQVGAIDPTLDQDQTAAWIMTIVSALYLHAATDEGVDATRHLPMLRRTIRRLVQP